MPEIFSAFLSHSKKRCDHLLNELMQSIDSGDSLLVQAMSYSLLSGGKRIRPVLTYATAQAVNSISTATDQFACALECIHTYSLIHDDLPAMDDDDLRRGNPTCHIQYDEATAILAGDALQCLAFETIASAAIASDVKIKAINELAIASGANGMVLGQMIDLESVDTEPQLAQLEKMHSYKTGALIEASVVLGALSAGVNDHQLLALRTYAKAIGLAFQVQDDIIDVTSDTHTLGKNQGSDIDKNKPTYVSLIGLEAAKEKAQQLKSTALEALAAFDEQADHLRAIATYIVERNH